MNKTTNRRQAIIRKKLEPKKDMSLRDEAAFGALPKKRHNKLERDIV